MSGDEFGSESVRVGRLIERLLVDPVFRAEFRADPVGVCGGLGLEGLAAELGSGKAMYTLELRESRSSLAGVVMAVAAEGVGVAELRGLVGHGLHGEARAAALKALHGGGLKEPRGLRPRGELGHLGRVVERGGLAGGHGAPGVAGSHAPGGGSGSGSVGFAGAGCGWFWCRRRRLRLGVVLVRRRRRGSGGRLGVVLVRRVWRRRFRRRRLRVVLVCRLGVVRPVRLGGWRLRRGRVVLVGRVVWRRLWVVVVLGRGVGLCRRRRVVGVGCCLSRLVVGGVGWWLGWFRRGLVLVVGGLGWGWVSCWRVRGCRCRRGCGRCLRRGVWIRGWCRCWGVRWSIIRLWWGGWSRWLIRCMRSR